MRFPFVCGGYCTTSSVYRPCNRTLFWSFINKGKALKGHLVVQRVRYDMGKSEDFVAKLKEAAHRIPLKQYVDVLCHRQCICVLLSEAAQLPAEYAGSRHSYHRVCGQ